MVSKHQFRINIGFRLQNEALNSIIDSLTGPSTVYDTQATVKTFGHLVRLIKKRKIVNKKGGRRRNCTKNKSTKKQEFI